MKLAKRENNNITTGEKIDSLENLHNAQLIQLERGDKKNLNFDKISFAFGIKNLVSVKSLLAAIEEKAKKESRKAQTKGNWCCVCCEVWTTKENGICKYCETMQIQTA